MTRPSRKTDEKLIEAAIALLPQTGYSALSMRAVAKKAGVNLGMFHYHFKNKEAFLSRVAQEFYGRFFQSFNLEIASSADPQEQLSNALVSVVKFARDNRRLMLSMVRDVLNGNQELVRLLEETFPKHATVLLQLIRQSQKQKKIPNYPIPMVITFLLGSMAGPIIIAALLEQVKLRQPYDFLKKMAVPYILSDPVIEKRLIMVMRGLDPKNTDIPVDPSWEKKADQFIARLRKKQTSSKSKKAVIKKKVGVRKRRTKV